MTEDLIQEFEQLSGLQVPEHDRLEWVLALLPARTSTLRPGVNLTQGTVKWECALGLHHFAKADTPLAAALRLTIELYKQGILKKGER